MKVIVQQIGKRLYLRLSGEWTATMEEANRFRDAMEALRFCVRKHLREVRLVSNFGRPGAERFLYPFGGDPAVKAERKRVRGAIRASHRLKHERRMILNMLTAEEKKKQLPSGRTIEARTPRA